MNADSTTMSKGIALALGSAVSIPVVHWILERILDALTAGGPPDQSGMVIAFVAFILWCVAAVPVMLLGIVMLLIGFAHQRRRTEPDVER